jgi:hypothetical protein
MQKSIAFVTAFSSRWIEPLFKARRVSDPLVLGSMVYVFDVDSLVVVVRALAVGVGPGSQRQAQQVACPARPEKKY